MFTKVNNCVVTGTFCQWGYSKDSTPEDGKPFVNEVDLAKILHQLESHEFIEELTPKDEVNEGVEDETAEQLEDFPFRNVSLPWEERVEDLVSRLTLEEITLQVNVMGKKNRQLFVKGKKETNFELDVDAQLHV